MDNNFKIHGDKRKKRFTQISNEMLQNNKLSFHARGFLSFILSFPEDWHFTKKGLLSVLNIGRSALDNIISELTENGFCYKEELRYSGRFEYKYHFFENPDDNYFLSTEHNLTDAEKPTSVEQHHINNIITNTLITNTIKEKKSIKKERDDKPYLKPMIAAEGKFDINYHKALSDWLEYKYVQHKFIYKHEKSFLNLYNELYRLSGGDGQKAEEIVLKCSARGYSGIYWNESNYTKKQNNSATSTFDDCDYTK